MLTLIIRTHNREKEEINNNLLIAGDIESEKKSMFHMGFLMSQWSMRRTGIETELLGIKSPYVIHRSLRTWGTDDQNFMFRGLLV